MEGEPNGYVSTSSLLQTGNAAFDSIVDYNVFRQINTVVEDLLQNMGIHGKVRCGAIVRLDHDAKSYMVVAKTIVGGTFFVHEEPWSDFPSDHFKTKLILAAG